jgi:hypothetical protein
MRELLEGETLEIATANSSITLSEPGEYRVEAGESDLTVLTVRGGVADVMTAEGPVRIASGQRVELAGREAQASLGPPADTMTSTTGSSTARSDGGGGSGLLRV